VPAASRPRFCLETKILRLLLVDPSPDDAELTLSALRKGGYLLKSQRVHDLAGLHAATEKGGWDAVLTELSLSRFNANTVLDTLRRARIDIPVIVVTRAIPDAEIASLMRAGVRDVVLKNQMARLLPALERELAVAAERAQHRATAQALKEIQDKHRAVVDGAREAIGYIHEGMHIDANKSYLDLFGYETAADLEGVPVMNLVDKNDHARFKQFIRKSNEPSAAPAEFLAIRKDGAQFHAEFSFSPISLNGEACTQLLVTDVSKRKAVETKLQYMNQHDPLTGIYNRTYFAQVLDQAIAAARTDGATQGLVFIDVGPLRQAGRDLGQAAVDRFLLTVTRELRETVGPRALLARWADREFTALIPDAPALKLAELGAAAEKAVSNLPVGSGAESGKCECRVAAQPVDSGHENAQALVAALEASATSAVNPDVGAKTKPSPAISQRRAPATNAAKPTLAAVAKPDNIDWPERVRAAIERESFRLIYQPIVNLHGDAGEYFEVLVRMVGDDGKLIPAAQFFPHAEATGQAVAIDRWVVKHSIHALAELHRQQRDVKFFVNLSVGALRDVELVVSAQQVLHETKLSGEHVIFEIDEIALTKHSEATLAFMRAAKKIGCSFCIDNFGRVLGATTKLREPPIEYLKLDGALVRNLAGDPVAQTSLRAVVEVAKAMDKKTIAKSVESAEALSVLWTYGIDYVQGHYFQEADSDLNYAFSDETTISSEASPQWTVASAGKSR
jgi:diguanylate cyclase (GGDEF)-like protein/PAS domain S-box-containing protein